MDIRELGTTRGEIAPPGRVSGAGLGEALGNGEAVGKGFERAVEMPCAFCPSLI
ncbi:MAG TPA: hypothetical protein VME69_07790 [Methylocella sp.]|nr:hypothetical protein [Methylocella sp.]